MSNPIDDAELARAITSHIIPVGDPVPVAVEPTAVRQEVTEAEKPEDKLDLGQNVEDFQIDIPPDEGM